MHGVQLLDRPAAFLTVFALTGLALLPVWIYLSPFYLAGITAAVNLGAQGAGIAPQFHLRPSTGEGLLLPGIVGGAALFVATPKRSTRWKVSWIALLVALSALVLASALFLQTLSAYAVLLEQLEPAMRLPLERNLSMPWLPGDGLDAVLPLFQPALYFVLTIALWFVATRGLSRA